RGTISESNCRHSNSIISISGPYGVLAALESNPSSFKCLTKRPHSSLACLVCRYCVEAECVEERRLHKCAETAKEVHELHNPFCPVRDRVQSLHPILLKQRQCSFVVRRAGLF